MASDRANDFGSKLRAARERKGVSLRQIASKTKISIAVLEALERNDIARLPGGIFSRAFVRSYAAEVGLDPETTIQEFIAQFPHDSITAGHPTSPPAEDFESLENDRRMATNLLWILAISIPLAGGVLYFSLNSRRAATTISSEMPQPPVSPTTGTTSEPVAPVESSPAAAAPVTAPPPPSASSSTAPAATSATDAPTDHLTIGLSARRPVWVSATVDGQQAISRLLQAGEKQTIDVKREMVITAGDAAALALTLNGAEGRSLGKPAEVVTARINLNNFKDYLAR